MLDVIGKDATGNAKWAKDIRIMQSFSRLIRGITAYREQLMTAQTVSKQEKLTAVAANDTRWEGYFRMMERFVRIQKSLQQAFSKSPELLSMKQEMGVSDFLNDTYFARIKCYLPALEKLHVASKAFQRKSEPTGALVCPYIIDIYNFLQPKENDGPVTRQFHSAVLQSLKTRFVDRWLSPSCDTEKVQENHNYLKASLFHCGYAANVTTFLAAQQSNKNIVSLDELMEEIKQDAMNIFFREENNVQESQEDSEEDNFDEGSDFF